MNLRSLLVLASFALAVAGATSPASAASDPLSYDDPGMHFKAPDGWTRITPASPDDPSDRNATGTQDKKLLAAFGYAAGKNDSRVISITAEPFDGTLDGAESTHETDLRNDSDTTLVDRKTKVTLANGMPAWFIKVSQGTDPFQAVRLYEYVIFDGTRKIVAAYSGRQFQFSEDDAKKAFASLYVVAYPRRRP